MAEKRLDIECRLCGWSGRARVVAPLDAYDLTACPSCGLVFLHPQPDAAALHAIHGSLEYFEHPYFEKRRGSHAVPDAFSKLHARVQKFGPFSRVLDIGCGTGELLLFLHKHFQCPCHGVDISEHAVKRIPQQPDIHPFAGDVRDAPYEADTFDLVVMIDLIEHVDLPVEVMSRVRHILRPGGVAYVQTLNSDCLIYRAGVAAARTLPPARGFARRIYPQFHPHYFSPGTMEMLIEKAGLRVEARFDEELDMADLSYSAVLKAGLLGFYALQKFTRNRSLQTWLVRKPG